MDYSQTGDVIRGLCLILDIALVVLLTMWIFRKD